MTAESRFFGRLLNDAALTVPSLELLAALRAVDEELDERDRRLMDKIHAEARRPE